MNEALEYKKNESKYLIAILFLISVYAFFGYLLPENSPYILLVTSVVALFFYFFIKRNLKITYKQLLPIIAIIFFIVSQLLLARYSLYPTSSMKVAINRSVIMLIGALVYLHGNWYKSGTKFLFVFSSIHVFFTIFSFLTNDLFSITVLPLIPDNIRAEILLSISRGVYSGITEQVAINAFYISVGISIMYSKILSSNEKVSIKSLILLGLFILTLLLTGKRGHLVANIVSMLFVSMYSAKIKGKSTFVRAIKVMSIVSLFFVILSLMFPEAATPIVRFIERQGGDQTSGRIPLYINAVAMFKEKPILGWGAGVFGNLYGIGTHNLYLQLLAENGLIGFSLFIALLFINFSNTIKGLKIANIFERKDILTFLYFSLYIQLFYLIYGLTGNPLNDGFILIIYLIASSIPFSLRLYKLKKG